MKKLLGIIVFGLLWCNVGFAEMRIIEEKQIESKEWVYLSVATICVDGYKFVISEHKEGTSIVQFYEAGNNQSPKPAKC